MKKVYFALAILFTVSLFTNCTTDSQSQSEQQFVQELPDLVTSNQLLSDGCYAGVNNMDINIAWALDCSIAQVTLSLCCNCLSTPSGAGIKSSCTLEPGVLVMQTEECPFDFYTYEYVIPEVSIQEGNCFDIVFDIENKGCNVAGISRFWFNGEPFEFVYDQSQSYCL